MGPTAVPAAAAWLTVLVLTGRTAVHALRAAPYLACTTARVGSRAAAAHFATRAMATAAQASPPRVQQQQLEQHQEQQQVEVPGGLRTYMERCLLKKLPPGPQQGDSGSAVSALVSALVADEAARGAGAGGAGGVEPLNARCHKRVTDVAKWLSSSPQEARQLQTGELDATRAVQLSDEFAEQLRARRVVGIAAGTAITHHHERMRQGLGKRRRRDDDNGGARGSHRGHAAKGGERDAEVAAAAAAPAAAAAAVAGGGGGSDEEAEAPGDTTAWTRTLEQTPAAELQRYASAMTVLTERQWVRTGYEWAASHCRDHLAGAALARALRKAARRHHFDTTGAVMPRSGPEEEALLQAMGAGDEALSWCRRGGDASAPIRLLDIGSCTNPFARMGGFEVTALDLCPADDSVYQADFLQVEVGPEGSAPVVVPPTTATSTTSTSAVVTRLPAAAYSAAVMSLVLSYVPLPAARAAMVARARALLAPPRRCPCRPWLTSPGGRLLIIEPYSTATGGRRLCDLPRLRAWVATIESLGFKFEEYTFLGRSHALAFSVTAGDAGDTGADGSNAAAAAAGLQIAFDDQAVYEKYQAMDTVGGRQPRLPLSKEEEDAVAAADVAAAQAAAAAVAVERS